MYLIAVGVNHRTSPLALRERLAFSPAELRQALAALGGGEACRGCVILQTCNRTEIYAAVTRLETGVAEVTSYLARKCGLPPDELRPCLYIFSLYEAVGHLFRVAAGLDSMIPGETEILGQVREAYNVAREEGASNNVLNILFQQAISVGKRVRAATGIDQNAVSLAYAAVTLARQLMGLQGRRVMVVGAGKMGTLVAGYLAAQGAGPVLVANRTGEKAAALAQEVGGQAVVLEELYDHLAAVDLVITCTGADDYVIRHGRVEDVLAARSGRPLVFIDLAVPRDVEPQVGQLPGVSLYNIDDLDRLVTENLERRQALAQEAEALVAQEVASFLRRLSTLSVVPTIAALKERGEEIKQAALRRAFNRLGPLGPREKRVITALANSIVNQLLHQPVINLKHYASLPEGHCYAEILQKLFGLEVKTSEASLLAQPRDDSSGGAAGGSAAGDGLGQGRHERCGAR